MVERHFNEDEGRQLLQRLQDIGYDTPDFWWDISTVKVDWTYALAISQRIAEPLSSQEETDDGRGSDRGRGCGIVAAEHTENLEEQMQRELVHRLMREEVAKLKQNAHAYSSAGLAKLEEFVSSKSSAMADMEGFEIRGKPVWLFGLHSYLGKSLGDDPTGSSIWMSTLVLSKVLEDRAARDLLPSSCKIVELGAGLGVASLMAWRLGCKNVTVTDRDGVLVSLLRVNAAAVYIESESGSDWDGDVYSLPIRIEEYGYGEKPQFLGAPFDLVLCSDLIYVKMADSTIRDIVTSCALLTRGGGEVLLAHAIRHESSHQLERFMAWMAEEGFDHAQLPLPSTASRCPDAAHKCVEMHSFVRK